MFGAVTCIILVVFSSLYGVQGGDESELDVFNKAYVKCLQEQELEHLPCSMTFMDETNDTCQCFWACIGKRTHMVTKDDEIDKEGFKRYLEVMLPDDDFRNREKAVLAECEGKVIHEGKCGKAYDSYLCFKRARDTHRPFKRDVNGLNPEDLYE